jgi:hypothetical protein
MKGFIVPCLAALATAAAMSVDMDITDELDFKMGLLPRQTVNNLQVFTGALGGAAAPAITQSDDPKKPFEVDGDKFVGCSVCLAKTWA